MNSKMNTLTTGRLQAELMATIISSLFILSSCGRKKYVPSAAKTTTYG